MAAKRAKKAANVEKFVQESGQVVTLSYDQSRRLCLFYGRDADYSNFVRSPFTLNGETFSCVEQYFQYMKAFVFGDKDAMRDILASDSPSAHKAIGRRVHNYIEVVWNDQCVDVMRKGVLAKFEQNSDLRRKMLELGDVDFVEASPRDRKWGIGLGIKSPLVTDPTKWNGSNLLGQILNEVRDKLMQAEKEAKL